MKPNGDRHFKVSEITEQIRGTLETQFTGIKIEGEISNFRPSSTGHYYFTLKDDNAMISAVMFRNKIRLLPFKPEDGQLVVVEGNISVYAKRGTYQVVCESIEKAGEGDILALLEKRKKMLASEGLFDLSLKKPLPHFPAKIGVVTSPTGAAIRDIIRVLRRRNAPVNVVVLPAPVQGDGAAEQIALRIHQANIYNMAEVLIVGRGGGSLEDLLPFSEECVVRAIAESQIPVISAVGHEIDTALSDLAADMRAPTPSAAAEIVAVDESNIKQTITELKTTIASSLRQKLDRIKLLVNQFSSSELERNFRILIQPSLLRLDDCKETLISGLERVVDTKRHRLQLLSGIVEENSPFSILQKGYAVVTDKASGKLLTSSVNGKVGEGIKVQFLTNALDADITEIYESRRIENEKF